jgi:3-oxoacyl-[acyl-carrier protein] reductase
MTDHYARLTRTPLGRHVVRALGLPDPPRLERYQPGQPVVDGIVRLGAAEGGRQLEKRAEQILGQLGVTTTSTGGTGPGAPGVKGLVYDASGIGSSAELVALRDFFHPVLRNLRPCGRVVVLATPPAQCGSTAERIAQRALEGFTRSLAKEVGHGSTVQLVYVAPGGEEAIASTLGFLLSPKSAYVSGQVIRIGATAAVTPVNDPSQPLAGRVALVTGAARGIGAAIASTLAREGAMVVGVDVPQAASALRMGMREIDGEALALDITSVDAAQRIARRLAEGQGGVDIVVHNAGITRDNRLRNLTPDRWHVTLAVNLTAAERITTELIDQQLIRGGGRIIGVASIAGIAGLAGQTNYATSKAGIIGLVEALAPQTAAAGITVNAVAPGFIETQMTAQVPRLAREAGRRMNSMAQGGLPIDVAESVAWLADPGSAGVNGNVVRVCGQSLIGA